MNRLFAATWILACSVAPAQGATPGPGEEPAGLTGFAWLKQFEGEWTAESDGATRCRIIGEKWIVNEFRFGGKLFAVQTLGYDEQKKQFVGTWVDSTSSFIWRYTGSLDPTGRVLLLDAEGPGMDDPQKIRQYRDCYEFKSKDEIAARSEMLDEAGEWQTFNTGTMKRKPQ